MSESESQSVFIKRPKKHYSPLRYPGGKAGLHQFIYDLIVSSEISNCTYFEPYSGGAGAALALLFLERVDDIIINDFDIAIYSFWKSILEEPYDFIKKIESCEISLEEWHKQREIYLNEKKYSIDLGFASFFLNRTNRSGIIYAGGPIGGKEQNGKWKIDARFNKRELISRIERVSYYADRIQLFNRDGIELMGELSGNSNLFIYADPPYYVKGGGLYLNSYQDSDHERLSNFLNSNPNLYWMLTYDNVPEIRNLYTERSCIDFNLNYHASSAKIGKEILVLSDSLSIKETSPNTAVS